MRAGEIAAAYGDRRARLGEPVASPRLCANPPRGGILQLPRAGRQQGQASSIGYVGGLCISGRSCHCGPCRCRCVGFGSWSHPSHRWRCIAATGPRRSPRSSARTTSPSRCATRSRTTGSTTPISSPARAAAARPPRPGSWPAPSTARGADRRSLRRVRQLQRAGPQGRGSIDVIEIDAASHGGVDDARDLREKAFFSPVRDRYKIYIIDEAHMVSTRASTPCSSWSRSRRPTCGSSSPRPSRTRCCRRSARAPTTTPSG